MIGRKTRRSTWMKRGEESNLSLMCQTVQQSNPTQGLACWNYRGYPWKRGPVLGPIVEGRDIICLMETHEHDGCKTPAFNGYLKLAVWNMVVKNGKGYGGILVLVKEK